MNLDFDIVEFIQSIAEELKDRFTINSFIDNADNTYTILTNSTESLQSNSLENIGVELVNFGSLSGKYLIDNIVVDTSFDIVMKYDVNKGLVEIGIGLVPVTTTQATTTSSGYQDSPFWESITPVFFHGEPELVNQKASNYPDELNKYPCIILDEPLRYKLSEQNERSGWVDFQANNIPLAFCKYAEYEDQDITKADFRNNAIIEMRKLALTFMAYLKSYDSEDNQINIRDVISADIIEFKNSDVWDFSPTGVYMNLSFKLENVYNICR